MFEYICKCVFVIYLLPNDLINLVVFVSSVLITYKLNALFYLLLLEVLVRYRNTSHQLQSGCKMVTTLVHVNALLEGRQTQLKVE